MVYSLDGLCKKAMDAWIGQLVLCPQPEALVSGVTKEFYAIVLVSLQKAAMKEQMDL
jgi:hypothetical protein